MYDLKAINYDPDSTTLGGLFYWKQTPEGYDYWRPFGVFTLIADLPPEAAAKIQAMRDQYERENLPEIGVLHDWDGSTNPPIPDGTDHTWWTVDGVLRNKTAGNNWSIVTQYLVHSYPEPKPERISGTVKLLDGKPDFYTWEADDA